MRDSRKKGISPICAKHPPGRCPANWTYPLFPPNVVQVPIEKSLAWGSSEAAAPSPLWRGPRRRACVTPPQLFASPLLPVSVVCAKGAARSRWPGAAHACGVRLNGAKRGISVLPWASPWRSCSQAPAWEHLFSKLCFASPMRSRRSRASRRCGPKLDLGTEIASGWTIRHFRWLKCYLFS